MTPPSEGKIALLAQDLALGAYLDALLQDVAAAPEIPPAPAPAATGDGPPAAPDAEPPPWARDAFQCLLFRVGTLKLAVPLVKLARILPWGAHVTALPGRPDWFLGLLAQNGRTTGVIDTGRLVFPRDRRSQAAAAERSAPGHILLIEGECWGLTCDALGEIVELSPQGVRWRSQRTARRWLAGTVLDQMCALLDVEVLARMVDEQASSAAPAAPLRSNATNRGGGGA